MVFMRAYSPPSNCFAGGMDAVLAYPNSTTYNCTSNSTTIHPNSTTSHLNSTIFHPSSIVFHPNFTTFHPNSTTFHPNSTTFLEGDEDGVKLRWRVLGLYALATLVIISFNMQKWLNIGLGLLTITMIGLFSRILYLLIEQGKVDGIE